MLFNVNSPTSVIINNSSFIENEATSGGGGAIFWNEYYPLLDTATWNLKNGNKALYRNFIGSKECDPRNEK